jgi:hypothetical protein
MSRERVNPFPLRKTHGLSSGVLRGGENHPTAMLGPSPYTHRSSCFLDLREAAHIGAQRLRHGHRTVFILVIFEDRDKRAANRDA